MYHSNSDATQKQELIMFPAVCDQILEIHPYGRMRNNYKFYV